MSNWTRKVMRKQKMTYVKEFMKQHKLNAEAMAGLCVSKKKKPSLNNKFNLIVDIQIQMLNERFKNQNKSKLQTTAIAEELNNGTKEATE